MRWRYLILGIVLAMPLAAAMAIWPEQPAYRIPGRDRYYLADNLATNELVFFCCGEDDDSPARLEFVNGLNGHLNRTCDLDLSQLQNWKRKGFWVHLSEDCEQLTWVRTGFCPATIARVASEWAPDRDSPPWDMQGQIQIATFAAQTGAFLNHVSIPADGYFQLSPDGRFFVVLQGDSKFLGVFDTRAGSRLWNTPVSVSEGSSIGSCFSPDSSSLLFHVSTLDHRASTVHHVKVETGRPIGSYELGSDRTLYHWDGTSLLTLHEGIEHDSEGEYVYRYLHRYYFDGKTLFESQIQHHLFHEHTWLRSEVCQSGSNCEIGQYTPYFRPERPAWIRFVERITSLNYQPEDECFAQVQIVDLDSKAVRYEMPVRHPYACRLALNHRLLVIDCQETPKIDANDPALWCGVAAASLSLPRPGGPFEVYRTDGIPRRYWIIAAVILELVIFAGIARWRHLAVISQFSQ